MWLERAAHTSRRGRGAGALLALAAAVAVVVLLGGGPVAHDASPPEPSQDVPSATAPRSPSAPPPDQRFGVVAHLLWGDTGPAIAQLDQLASAGLGVIRFDVSWRNMEPHPGEIEGLDRLDALMTAIRDHRMRPIVTVIETPGWANGERGPWTPPDDAGTYARFVGQLAARYVAVPGLAWEIWNEPNDPKFWQPAPDPAAYTNLLRHAADAIRTAAPAADVLGGSILYGDAAFLQGMYDAGAAGAMDGLAVHPYAQNRAPADTGDPYHSFLGGLERLRRVMVDNGAAGVRMWITEAGWTTADGVDDATRGRYLAEAAAMVAARDDVEVFAAYVFGPAAEGGYGLSIDGPGSVPFAAYRDAVIASEGRAP